MIELETEARRKPVAVEDDPPSNYLVLGDFGGRAAAPMAIDRDIFDGVLSRMDVHIGATPFRELDDFHPDRLCRSVPLFHEFNEPGRDAALGERMRGLLHQPQFQAIESAWRGVDFVVRGIGGDSDESGATRVYIAQYSREDANRDLLAATSLHEARILELLNARKWRAIVGLYRFGPDGSDMEFLGRMALLAAQARSPFLGEGSVDMGPHWSELTAIPEAAYLGLVLPRFLLRLPYGTRTSAIDSFAFEEMPGVPVHGGYLWGNPALACLALLASCRGTLNLSGLPLHNYQKDGEWSMTPCAEVLMTEGQVLALIEAGLMPLVSYVESDRVRLAGFRAINGEELPIA